MRTGALRLIWSNPRQYVCMFFLLVCAWALGVRLVHQAPLICVAGCRMHMAQCILQRKWGAWYTKRTPSASCYANGGLATPRAHQGHTKGTPRAHQGHTKGTPSGTPSAHQVAHQVHPAMQMGGLIHERKQSAHQVHPATQTGGLVLAGQSPHGPILDIIPIWTNLTNGGLGTNGQSPYGTI
jgi:hypothetical protein